MFFFANKKVLGLDIGSNSIKVVELEYTKKSAKLLGYSTVPTPAGTVSGGEILDSSAVSQAINSAVSALGTKRRAVATGLWGNAIIVKKINLPSMDVQLLSEQIRWEAEQYIPYDIEEINLEYHVIKSRTAAPDTMDVLLVGARKDLIMTVVESVELAQVQCSILDVNGFALANCFTANHGELPGEVVAVLDIGAGITNFVVIDNGEVVFARDIPVGGTNYTSEIQRNLNITMEEAEGLKLDCAAGRPAPPEVSDIIQNQHENITEEISKSIEFYTATASDYPIQKMFLTGAASLTPGLKDHIQGAAHLPVEFFNPLAAVEVDRAAFSHDQIAQIAPSCAIAVGLGMREQGDR